MTVNVAEAELLREEVAELRAALAARDATIVQKDEAIATRDQALAEMARKLRLTAEERDWLKRRLFGTKSERVIDGPSLFAGLGADLPEPPKETAPDDEESTLTEREKKQTRKKPTGRKPLPEHFPRRRVEHPLPEDQRHCTACGTDRVRIGEETSELVHVIPAQYEVEVHVRGKFACRCGEGGVVTPALPPRPIPGSYAGPSLIAQTLVAKYDDHLPLYRQAEIFRRAGFDLARSTLCDWIGGVMPLLAPVAAAVRGSVVAGSYVQADETPVRVQKGPEGRPKDAYFWVYRAPESGEILYDFRMGRGGEGPADILRDFRGTLQTDAYVGYDAVVRQNTLVSAGCMAHCRRKFHEALESSPQEASLVIVAIRRLYKIEERASGMSAEERLRLREAETVPGLAELKCLIESIATTATPSSRIGKACAYALGQWEHLTVFASDGRVEIDNNRIESSIRNVAVGRANWLACGNAEGGRRAAVMYTLIESCKAAGVEPFAYLTDLLTRLPAATDSQIASFTPRAWAAARRS